MKKQVFGRQLKRDANERKALFKNLLTSLVLEERIVTTPAKAKAIRAAADKLVTKAKKGGEEAYARLAPDVRHVAAEKLVKQIAPLFATREGGYTRIIKVGNRVADNAPQVIMEWVERPVKVVEPKAKKAAKKAKPAKAEKAGKKTELKATASNAAGAAAVAKPAEGEAPASTRGERQGRPVKEAKTKAVKSSAPKKVVTRQKKG